MTEKNRDSGGEKIWLIVLSLCVFVLMWRVVGPELGLPSNFTPAMALTLAAGLWLRRAWSAGVVFGCVMLADMLLNVRYGAAPLTAFTALSLFCYGVAWWIGHRLGPRVSWPGMLGGGLAAALFFYLVSNTASWAMSPGYVKSFGGWVQALTVGLPGYPPTWQFFTSSLLSDLGFLSLIRVVVGLACSSPSVSRTGNLSA